MGEAAFQRALCTDSDDDTARLVFAEHGRPEQSAFIHAQVELA